MSRRPTIAVHAFVPNAYRARAECPIELCDVRGKRIASLTVAEARKIARHLNAIARATEKRIDQERNQTP
jgi:hypothetical protein